MPALHPVTWRRASSVTRRPANDLPTHHHASHGVTVGGRTYPVAVYLRDELSVFRDGALLLFLAVNHRKGYAQLTVCRAGGACIGDFEVMDENEIATVLGERGLGLAPAAIAERMLPYAAPNAVRPAARTRRSTARRSVARRPRRKNGPARTYKAAQAGAMNVLEARGWTIKRGLKVPQAVSPDRERTAFFKAQAIYMGPTGAGLGGALSLWMNDLRTMTDAQIADDIERSTVPHRDE